MNVQGPAPYSSHLRRDPSIRFQSLSCDPQNVQQVDGFGAQLLPGWQSTQQDEGFKAQERNGGLKQTGWETRRLDLQQKRVADLHDGSTNTKPQHRCISEERFKTIAKLERRGLNERVKGLNLGRIHCQGVSWTGHGPVY